MHDPGRQAKVRRIPGLLRKGGRTRARGGVTAFEAYLDPVLLL